jgi:hypothetical protein
MFFHFILPYLWLGVNTVVCLRYALEYADWNWSTNQQAYHPLEYSGAWENYACHPSPSYWRFQVYTLSLSG